MLVNWLQEDARQWARFSGDNNPIHFDGEYALSMGCDGVVVHGMRAMLDIKKALTERLLLSHPQADFYRFTARLRQPLDCNKPYRLALMDMRGGAEAKLYAAEANGCCITARLAPAEAETQGQWPAPHALDPAALEALSLLFPGNAASAAERWSFLDGVLFRQLLASSELVKQINAVSRGRQMQSFSEFFTQFHVVQTHHEVLFSARLFQASARRSLHFSLLPAQIIGSPQNGLVVQVAIQACEASGKPLLSCAVTLKTGPQHQ